MEYNLFDYQREAAVDVLKRLSRGHRDWTEDRLLSAFALSAITGAGKTVIATAVIEAVIYGSADLGVDPAPRATFLWVTDDPALNRQTRNRMLESSDILSPLQLIEIENDFTDSELAPGNVYFLNIQKLSKTSGLAKSGTDERQYSMWEVIANSINNDNVDFYLVLDEAHKGMKPAADRNTIVQRIISGQVGSNPPVPVAWGISATIERFANAMAGAKDRTTYPPVAVDIEKVRASGIIKDKIDLDEPSKAGSLSVTLLRSAIDATLDFEHRWAQYASSEHEPLVLPVLVIQVDNKPSDAHLAEIVSIVESRWPGLGPYAMVNVFGEHLDLVIGGRKIRWVSPESIQNEDGIRVVLAKEAISTGWDCPRAEVLYSERAANDATHIAQIIGRMVRSPLAHRIATDDALNSVTCFLPKFNRKALHRIADELTKPGEVGAAAEVTINAQTFERNRTVPVEVFEAVSQLPSWPPPDALSNPLRRAKILAKLLTDSSPPGGALLANAGQDLTRLLNSKFDGLMAQYASAVADNVKNIETGSVETTSITTVGDVLGVSSYTVPTATQDIDRETRRRVATMREGVASDYVKYRVARDGNENANVLSIRTQVAALLMLDGVTSEINAAATKWVQELLAKYAVEIKNSSGAMRDAYQKVKEQTSDPEEVGIELPMVLRSPTRDSTQQSAELLATFAGHMFAGQDGLFPANLNDWERQVISTEIARPSFVSWYRNPQRAITSSLRVAYRNDTGAWSPLQVDFLVVSRRADGNLGVSIVDPHGDYLADARAKLRGLVDYAERFGDRYVRIESINKVADGRLRVLDLLEPTVRETIREFEGGKVTMLYESSAASDWA